MSAYSIRQLEKNVVLSFSYVKKDLLNLNDGVSNLSEKIQHLSLNDAALIEKLSRIEQLLNKKTEKTSSKAKSKTSGKKELEFYDVKRKKNFTTNKYKIEVRSGRKFAVTTTPSKTKAYRMLGAVKGHSQKKKAKKVRAKTTKKKISKSPRKVITETVLYE